MNHHVNFSDSVDSFNEDPGCRRTVLKGTLTGRPSKQYFNYEVSGLLRNQHHVFSHRIDSTAKTYFLRPETRHRPQRSSQYDAFRLKPEITVSHPFSQNEKKHGNILDFASREIYSFIRLNDAFRKTSLQAAKNKYKKLTDYENNFYRAR